MTATLKPGDSFPEMFVKTTHGETLALPADLEAQHSILLFYRGHW